MISVANDLIGKYGDTIEIVTIVQSVYNPNTGETDKTNTSIITKGYISSYKTSQVIPNLIESDDLKLLITQKVTIADKKDYNGNTYSIINVAKVTTQDNTITYEAQIRNL